MGSSEKKSEPEEILERLLKKVSSDSYSDEPSPKKSSDDSLTFEDILTKLKVANSEPDENGHDRESLSEKKENAVDENEDDGYEELEFDDSPIIPDYKNYNMIGNVNIRGAEKDGFSGVNYDAGSSSGGLSDRNSDDFASYISDASASDDSDDTEGKDSVEYKHSADDEDADDEDADAEDAADEDDDAEDTDDEDAADEDADDADDEDAADEDADDADDEDDDAEDTDAEDTDDEDDDDEDSADEDVDDEDAAAEDTDDEDSADEDDDDEDADAEDTDDEDDDDEDADDEDAEENIEDKDDYYNFAIDTFSDDQLAELDIAELFGFSEIIQKDADEKYLTYDDGDILPEGKAALSGKEPNDQNGSEDDFNAETGADSQHGDKTTTRTAVSQDTADSDINGEQDVASDSFSDNRENIKKERKKISTPIEDESVQNIQESDSVPKAGRANREYTAHSQTGYIKSGYRVQLEYETVRTAAAAILFIAAFLIENLDLFGIGLLSVAVNPLVASLVSLLISLAALWLCLREAYEGFFMLLKARPMPESAVIPLFAVSVIYLLLSFLSGGQPKMVFGAVFCLFVFLCKVRTFLRLLREIKTFAVISSEKPKRILCPLSADMSVAESNAFKGYVDENTESYCVKRSLFYSGYFSETGKYGKKKIFCGIFLLIAFLAATVVFLSSFLTGGSFVDALSYAAACLFLTLPFCCAVSFEIPLFCCADVASKRSCAIVGEAAFDALSRDGIISFSDNDIFPQGNIRLVNIVLFGKKNVEKILEYTALVFYEINSSVSKTILKSIPSYKLDDGIIINEIYDDGIDALINDERVLVGSRDFLLGYGIAFPKSYREKKTGYALMYVAVSDSLAGRFDFDYAMDPDVGDSMRHICDSGKYIAVRTLDPNITPTLMSDKIDYQNVPLRLVKQRDDRELWRMRKRVSGPVVSLTGTKALMSTLAICTKGIFWLRAAVIAGFASFAAGCALVASSLAIQNVSLLNSRSIILFHLLWTLVSFLPAVFIRLSRRRSDKNAGKGGKGSDKNRKVNSGNRKVNGKDCKGNVESQRKK